MRLRGVSPHFNEGQRINLNLNVVDNIPDLLENLQATRSIIEAMESRF